MTRPVRRKAEVTTLDELNRAWQSRPDWAEAGVRVAQVAVGDPDDPNSPVVFHTFFPAGFKVDAHTHACDYIEIMIQGSQQVTGRWHEAGAVRMVRAGTVYGPLVAGSDGVTVVSVFRDQRIVQVDPADAAAIVAAIVAAT